ncbi:MAG: cation:proton antiporter [Candidatus Methanomethylophilaceae archaeon]|nr:cation:proton antiporter [Candidatus Methanomethylophilaceae archaeon]
MDESLLLLSLALFTVLAGACSIVFNKAKLPPLIGYLTAGIVIANFLSVSEPGMAAIEILSDVGLILLMFCIGLEINLKKIRKKGRFAIVVAGVQLPLTVILGFVSGGMMGMGVIPSIVLGAVLSGCSTAAVMSVMTSQRRFTKEHMEVIILIIIIQDIGQVVMLSTLTPVLAGSSMEVSGLVVLITSIAVFMVVSIVAGLRVIPVFVNWVSDNVSKEVLLVVCLGFAFLMAWVATVAGLSMAIGAFMAGLLISVARNSKDIEAAVDPMKSLFMSMFFISVGMEVHLATLSDNIVTMILFYLMFAGFLVVTVFLGFWLNGEKGRFGFVSAVSMTAMGEFAFIISKEALEHNVVDDAFYTSIIGAALLSMVCMPILSRYSDGMWDLGKSLCPKTILGLLRKLNGFRDGLYANVRTATSRTQRHFRRSMTHAYINIIAIMVVILAFYVAVPMTSPVLNDMFGGGVHLWDFVLVMLNLVALIPPTKYLVDNVKFLDRMVVENARRLASRERDPVARGSRFPELLEMNTYFAVVTIDLAIIAVVPNPLSLEEHIFVALAAALILAVILLRIKNMEKESPVEDTDDVAEEADADDPTDLRDDGVRLRVQDSTLPSIWRGHSSVYFLFIEIYSELDSYACKYNLQRDKNDCGARSRDPHGRSCRGSRPVLGIHRRGHVPQGHRRV